MPWPPVPVAVVKEFLIIPVLASALKMAQALTLTLAMAMETVITLILPALIMALVMVR